MRMSIFEDMHRPQRAPFFASPREGTTAFRMDRSKSNREGNEDRSTAS